MSKGIGLKPQSKCDVSVVVTTFSRLRAPLLHALFESIARQSRLDRLQLVVVVERDYSLAVQVGKLLERSKLENCLVLYYSHLDGMSDARNKGAEQSSGDVIVFVDDDVVVDPGWLESILVQMSREDVVAITGPSSPLWEGSPVPWIPQEFTWLIGSTGYFTPPANGQVRNVWGNNMAVRKRDFFKVGGFLTGLGLHNAGRTRWSDPPSEDVDLSFRLSAVTGGKIMFVPSMSVGHWVTKSKFTWRYIAQRAYSVGSQRRAILRYSTPPEVDLMRTERHLVIKIVLLIPRCLALTPVSPRKSLNIGSMVLVVSVFSALGFLSSR